MLYSSNTYGRFHSFHEKDLDKTEDKNYQECLFDREIIIIEKIRYHFCKRYESNDVFTADILIETFKLKTLQ